MIVIRHSNQRRNEDVVFIFRKGITFSTTLGPLVPKFDVSQHSGFSSITQSTIQFLTTVSEIKVEHVGIQLVLLLPIAEALINKNNANIPSRSSYFELFASDSARDVRK